MHPMLIKKWTLCGVMASAVLIAATSALPVMTGGCGANETLICESDDEDAGADDGGQGGNKTGSTGTGFCD